MRPSPGTGRTIAAALLLGLGVAWVRPVFAQGFPAPFAPLTVRSVSGQFVVHGERPEVAAPGVIPELRDEEWVDLDPNVLAVLAERVRGTVDRRLGGIGRWRGKIELTLRPAARMQPGPIRIIPQPFREGCQVLLVVPDRIQVGRLVRALVEAILIEASNRDGTGRVAQAPLWLNEGLAGIIQVEGGTRFLLEQGTSVHREGRRPDPLREARSLLRGTDPVSFSEMGLARVEDLGPGPEWDRFRASAILLTHELLRDAWGRDGIRAFLSGLGRHLNWQTTFLEAFSGRFVSLLEVEKWWAVNAAHELARDPGQQWPADRVLESLAGIAVEPAEVRATPDSPAERRLVPLDEVATRWDAAARTAVLDRKIGELHLLYAHTPPDLTPFVLAWHDTVQGLLGEASRGGAPLSGPRTAPRPASDRRTRQLLRRLGELQSELDHRRAAVGSGGG